MASTHYTKVIIMRSAIFCALQLLALPEDQQLETLQAYMLAAAAEAAGIDELDPDQPLLELGLDSLRAAEFAVQVRFPLIADTFLISDFVCVWGFSRESGQISMHPTGKFSFNVP